MTQGHAVKMNFNKIPALDFMRAAGVVAVALGHFLQFIGFRTVMSDLIGYLCMNLFFVLSGFLIGSLVFGEIKGAEKLNVLNFYLRRNFKLLPSYYIVLLLYFAVPSVREDPLGRIAPFWRFATFTQNYFSSYGTFLQAWSLCVEEQFYLLFPWVALLLCKLKPGKAVTGFVLFISFCVLLRLAIWMVFLADSADIMNDIANYIYFPTWARADSLAIGCLIAYLRFFSTDFWSKVTANPRRNLMLFVLLIFAAVIFQLKYLSWYGAAFTYLFASAAFAAFILYAVNPLIWLNMSPSRMAGLIAKLSYSIYLTHKMSFKITDDLVKLSGLNLSPLLYFLVTFIAVFAIASLLHYLVELPIGKWAKRFSK